MERRNFLKKSTLAAITVSGIGKVFGATTENQENLR